MQYALNMQYVGSRQSMMARPLLYSNLTPQIWIWRSDNDTVVVYILKSLYYTKYSGRATSFLIHILPFLSVLEWNLKNTVLRNDCGSE